MKKKIIGWVAKDVNVKDCINFIGEASELIIDMEERKGLKGDWFGREWPPKKVTVTVEWDDRG